MILQQKRHLCLFAAAWIFGTVLYCRKEDVWLLVLFLLAAVLTFGIAQGGKRRERTVVTALVLALILTAFFVCGFRDRSDRRIREFLETAPGTELSGTVIQKEIQSDRCLYYLKTPYKKVIVYSDTDEIPIGSDVRVSGKWQSFSHASNEGSFDYAENYREQNISFRIFAEDMAEEREPSRSFREGLYRLRKRICAVFAESLRAQEAGVLSTLTVGNRGLLDPDVREMYQNAGISHILAISGLHISILGLGLYRFLRKARLPCHLCEGLGCGVILCFVIMSGMSVSALRALVMYLLLMGARAAGRTYDPPTALAAAALALLIPNPLNLYRSGFQFSFLAMAAIVLFSAVSERLEKERQKREKRARPGSSLRDRLLFGAFLQMAMLPLTAWYYYEVPLYATFLNLLILPLCSALLGFGLAGGILGILFPQAAKWLLIPCHLILRFYEGAVTLVNRMPLHQWITGQPSAWLLLFFYAALAGACVLCLTRIRSAKGHAPRFFLVPLALLICILTVPERQHCRIDFLDVGQGDGIFLTDGAGTRVMIDGGSSTESGAGTYIIEPFLKYHGIRGVDAWILTHGDADHYSGLLEILEDGYPVRSLVLAEAMPRDGTWAKLVSAAGANGTEVVYVKAGDGIALADSGMTCLYPGEEEGGESRGGDGNEFSQVWLFEKGPMSVLFTGDLEEEQERLLLERGMLRDNVVLKVGHHGSKYSTCTEFLETVSPEYAVISCGEHNLYGHPAPETLERLADAGCGIYQTPQCGQITFYEKRGRWKLHTYLQESE